MMRLYSNPGALKSIPLFSQLTEGELAGMLPAMQQRTYAARAAIVRAGEPADGLYIIVSGRVRVCLDDGNGHEIIVASFGPNDFFGEVGLIEGGERFANVHAVQPCEVLYVPRKTVLEWLTRDHAAAMSMLTTLVQRLGDAYRKVGSLALIDVYGRVARVLLESGREANGEWLVDVGSEQIAAIVGASREMVSRVIKNMIGRGVVRRYKRKIIVLDRDSLLERAPRPRRISAAQKKEPTTSVAPRSSPTIA